MNIVKNNQQSYANEITEHKVNILKILEQSEQNAISSTDMLNCQSEALKKIDSKLDSVHEELKMSDKIVRSMMGFFDFFPRKILGKDKSKNNNTSTKRTIPTTIIPNDDESHKDQYYDEVSGYLHRLKNQALTHREILSEQTIVLDNISNKTGTMSKNIKIIESNMKKI